MRSILTLLIILSLSSCSKDDASPDIYTGEASALKNGEAWVAKVRFIQNEPFKNGMDMNLDVFNNNGYHREGMYIYRIQNNRDVQFLENTDSQINESKTGFFYGTLIDDGDVLGDIYELDTTASDNFIQILTYNSFKAEVEGVFNVTLVLSRDDEEGEIPPQKLVFTNGTFKAKVEREWFE